MTTIVVSENTIAADSQLTADGLKEVTTEKLIQRGPYVYGIAGCLAAGLKFVAWLERNNDDLWADDCPLKDDEDTQVLRFNLETGETVIFEAPGYPLRVEGGTVAIGSGAAVAYGALHMGATAVQAVDAARQYDDGTGGDIKYFCRYLDNGPRWI